MYSLYIADFNNNRVQKYTMSTTSGTTVAGIGNGTGCTSSVCLSGPTNILVDSHSDVYITETRTSRIQFWPSGSSSGVTVAGNSE